MIVDWFEAGVIYRQGGNGGGRVYEDYGKTYSWVRVDEIEFADVVTRRYS